MDKLQLAIDALKRIEDLRDWRTDEASCIASRALKAIQDNQAGLTAPQVAPVASNSGLNGGRERADSPGQESSKDNRVCGGCFRPLDAPEGVCLNCGKYTRTPTAPTQTVERGPCKPHWPFDSYPKDEETWQKAVRVYDSLIAQIEGLKADKETWYGVAVERMKRIRELEAAQAPAVTLSSKDEAQMAAHAYVRSDESWIDDSWSAHEQTYLAGWNAALKARPGDKKDG